MRPGILFLFLTLTISGCISYSGPKNNAEFGYINKPSDLAGIYKNKGEPGDYLTRYVFKSKKGFERDIQYIQVEVTGDTLLVGAVYKGCIVYSEEYTHDKDFEISNGRITIKTDFAFQNRGVGDPLAGPTYESQKIGLDTRRDVKLRNSGIGGGLIYMFFPVLLSNESDVRFERVHKHQLYKKCR